ncbi:MAG: zinc-ribbon domain-containing protein [Archangium sp.]
MASAVVYGPTAMDVGCPKCQTEYELDDSRVTEDGVTVKCTTCGHVFRVKKKQLVVTLPAKEGVAPSDIPVVHSADLPPPPPSREWKLRNAKGAVVPCRDLTMLQKWIIEGKVQRNDEISLTGDTWKRLGEIPELSSFFAIVEEANKARVLEAQVRNTPSGSAPIQGKITDTWKGGTFTTPAPEPLVPRETLDEPTPPKKRESRGDPQFTQAAQEAQRPKAVTETLQGGKFPAVPPPPPKPEPSEEELRRAVGKSGSGKWIALVIIGLLVGGGVGYYFGIYEPEQRELQRLKEEEEARARTIVPPPVPVIPEVVDAGVEEVDAGVADDAGVDAGVEDAGVPDAGVTVDAGVPDAGVVIKPTFDGYLRQADSLRNREKPEASLDFYDKAADLKPERVEPLAGRGLALLDMANPTAAIDTFARALKVNGRYGPAIMGMAEAQRMAGHNDKAIEFYEKYLEVLPDGAEAAVARNSIERLKR